MATTVLLMAVAAGAALAPANQLPLPTRLALAASLATWPLWTRALVRTVTRLGHGLPIVVRATLGLLVLTATGVVTVLLLANSHTLAGAPR